jgi:hypothetical protein
MLDLQYVGEAILTWSRHPWQSSIIKFQGSQAHCLHQSQLLSELFDLIFIIWFLNSHCVSIANCIFLQHGGYRENSIRSVYTHKSSYESDEHMTAANLIDRGSGSQLLLESLGVSLLCPKG